MIYRIILYVLAMLAYGFAQYFADLAPANAENLFEFWLILFGLIILDTGYQVRTSLYALFPLGYLIGILLQYANVGGGMIYQGMGAWLHTGLGIWLLYLWFRPGEQRSRGPALFLVAALGCFLFGVNGVNHFLANEGLSRILHLRLSSYLIIATAGQFLLSDQLPYQYPAIRAIFRLVLIIHVFLLIGRFTSNFF